MKVLIWESKHDNEHYDISTPKKEAAAFLSLFRSMDEQGDYECCEPEGEQVPLYEKAKKGDAAAAKAFILMRSQQGYEYETVRIDDASDASVEN